LARKVILLLIVALLGLPISMSMRVTADSPRVLRVAATASVTTWDPIMSFSTEALYMANIYEPLLWVNGPNAKEPFRPGLAEKWETAADGLSWTFHLRKGVKFHDGAALDATAVKRSLERSQASGGASFIWAPVDKIVAVDDLTVKFQLKSPAPVDLIASSLYGAWIVSPKALDAVEKDKKYFEAGIEAGTGPYTLKGYKPDSQVELAAFPDYWGGWSDAKHFDNVVISIVSDATVQQQMLSSNEVDLAFSLPATAYDTFAKDSNFTVNTYSTVFNYVGFLNTTRPPLDNKLVRQAISYAIPYDDIIKVGAEGRGTQARGPVPKGIFPYSDDVKQYKQDLAKAQDLMKQAGITKPIDLTLTYAAENDIEKKFAPVLADALSKININVKIQPMLFNQQWELGKGDPTKAQDIFLLLYWPTYSDAGSDNLNSMFHSSEKPFFNLSYWKNADFDKLVDQAITLTGTDRAAAQKAYTQAQNLLVDEAAGLFFMDVGAWYAVPKYIQGFDYNPNYAFAQFFYPLTIAS